MSPRRGEVYLVALDPTRGREIRKTRPCAVDEGRLLRRLGKLSAPTLRTALKTLQEMFAE